MPLPRPHPGLVICYEFLWSHEHEDGATQGEKRRPCVIVLAIAERAGGTQVTVAPVTHRQPDAAAHGVEIPRRVKDHLGLDQQRSWIIATDLNEFLWPGDHMFPIPGGRLDQFDYGTIPQKLLSQVVERIDALAGAALHRIPRDEE
ncbi:type II toxin-antitoxin system PemK/MazF family toxin [Caenispirillum salinarum]|uniref:type II toxin-antitoxin system PemK/MazF family toxin n=1 Tax=Caenispirillum salinarum TaxID=859058 RepID=UPI0005BC9BE3|nr:type II toxin-antitoxin system PemK/MazF family toxin [Caenispirillum salinarum]